MGLKATLANAVNTAFTVVADLTQDVVYTNPGITVYNTTTGRNTTTGASTSTIKAVFIQQPYDTGRMSSVEEFTPQVILKASDFTQTLTVDGFFTIGGAKYQILSWATDPSSSLYTIDVARST